MHKTSKPNELFIWKVTNWHERGLVIVDKLYYILNLINKISEC